MDLTNSSSPSSPPEANPEPMARMRILVVDDSFDNARLLAMMLDLLGHESRFVTDGESALALIPIFNPDVVFSDICMDELDGFHLAQHIRSDDTYRATTLVVHSGRCDAAGRDRAMAAGFDFYLVKPAEPTTLVELLTKIASLKNP